jgi:hypothetical protein
VRFWVDFEGIFDELCRRVDKDGIIRIDLASRHRSPANEIAAEGPYRIGGQGIGPADIRVVKCRRPMACTRPLFRHWPKLVRHAELPIPTLMVSMTTEYRAGLYEALSSVVDLAIGYGLVYIGSH